MPDWENFAPEFIKVLQQVYQGLPRPIGYVEVADLRDRVCFELRLPDYLFDDFLKRTVQSGQKDELPLRVHLDSSLAQGTPLLKRAPLEFGEGVFNLVRIQAVKTK